MLKISIKNEYSQKSKKENLLFASGHRACAGCGQAVAAKAVMEALGSDVIIANATGCLEVTTTPYPQSAWGVPWIHSLFENASAIASGIRASLDYKIKSPLLRQGFGGQAYPSLKKENIKVVAQGGDGGTFDIGLGLISGMWERGENILYICYDTQYYSNTGMQASGATPWGAASTTTPAGTGKTIDAIGSHLRKKDMIAIALAHRVPYVAQTTAGYIADIKAKIKKAKEINGPAYIQILTPCVPGWGIKSDQAIAIAKLAAQTGLYPLLEFENGILTKKMSMPKETPKVEAYLEKQGRFKHLFATDEGKKQIAFIQKTADENIEKYNFK